LTAGLRTAAAVVGDPGAESLVAQRDSRTICLRVRLVCYSLKQFKFRTIEY